MPPYAKLFPVYHLPYENIFKGPDGNLRAYLGIIDVITAGGENDGISVVERTTGGIGNYGTERLTGL